MIGNSYAVYANICTSKIIRGMTLNKKSNQSHKDVIFKLSYGFGNKLEPKKIYFLYIFF